MTNQHRATIEQWAAQEQWNAMGLDGSSCILELRARVEALEAAQRPRFIEVVTSGRTDEERPPKLDLTGATFVNCAFPSATNSSPPTHADSLLESVARHVAALASDGLPGDDAKPTASAAIREVAAWLDALPQDYTASANYFADMLQQEANK